MKKYLLLIIIFSSQVLFAQSKKQFSHEIDKFEPELVNFLKNKSHKGYDGKAIADTFLLGYSSYSTSSKKLIIDLLNNIRKSRFNQLKYYDQTLQSIVKLKSLKKENGANIDTWLKSYNEYITDKKITTKQKRIFIETNFNTLANSLLNPRSSKNKWSSSNKLIYSSRKDIRYSIDGAILYCTSGSNKFYINDVYGYFSPSDLVIKVSKAKIYWNSKSFTKDSLYAVAKNFTIDVKQKGFVADSVVLHNKYFFNKNVLGSIENKAETNDPRRKIYPVFKSYKNDYLFNSIAPDIDFKGGIMLRKNNILGVGDYTDKAILHIKNSGKESFIFASESFIFSKKSIFSNETSVSIRLMEDSIYHPQLAMRYDLQSKKLTITKNNNKLSEAPYSNSYNGIDMFLNSMTWKKGDKQIVFNTEDYISVPFVSDNYYDESIIDQFQGLNRVNPLVELYNLYMYNQEYDYLTINYIAEHMNMPKSHATHMLMELTSLGYLYTDIDLERVRFPDKFFNLVDAYKGSKDYDAIVFHAPKSTSIHGSINLENGEVSLLNIDRINLSTRKKVSVVPTDTVTINKALNMRFNGSISVGNYKFEGSDYNFNYDDFKIVMNGNQRMQYFVPSWETDSLANPEYVRVINPIDSLRGELYIDDPSNKSGSILYADFPKFNNTRDAYVFYDLPEIKQKYYNRSELYVKLAPFELDSLTTVSSRDVKFYGTIHTSIFPDFNYFVKVQKDLSLGFSYNTGEDGFSVYNKGVFHDSIRLDTKGLNGEGRLSYLSAEIKTDKIEFYPDSLKSIATNFNIDYNVNDSLNTPKGYAENVSIFWMPSVDSMSIRLIEDSTSTSKRRFVFYDSTIVLDGQLAFIKNNLTASGRILSKTAEISSNHYNLYGDSINSNLLDFKLREASDAPSEVVINNSAGVIDLSKREGRFTLNEDNAYVKFVQSKYIAYTNKAVWKIDDRKFELSSDENDLNSWFVSVDPAQDSLRFQAMKASYSLDEDKLEASEVYGITVADALITPKDNKLEILDNGWMQGFEDAEVKIGIGANEHKLDKANITIRSSHELEGNAIYNYYDVDSLAHPISISSIYVDSLKNKVVGHGDILPKENFMLNPHFKFNGDVIVSGESEFLKFKGYSSIKNRCNNVDIGEIPIYSYIDPNNVNIETNNFNNQSQYLTIYNGIYAKNKSYSAAFLSTNRYFINHDFISAKGSLLYDKENSCYKIGGKVVNGIKQDEIIFYNDKCKIEASGELKFYNPDKVIEIKSYGKADYNMRSNKINLDAVLGINFEFNKLVTDEIRHDLQATGSKGASSGETEIQKFGFSRLLNKSYEDYSRQYGDFSRKFPEELQFKILFSNLKLSWDPYEKLFLSDDKIEIHSFNGHIVDKAYTGKIEIKRRDDGDEITVYFVTLAGKYYYFNYKANVMNFYTNNLYIMKKFDKISDKRRKKEINGFEYRYKKASKMNVRLFQNKYILLNAR